LKQAVKALLLSPLAVPLSIVLGGGATCLMYHHIARGTARRDVRFRPNIELFVAEEELDKQMRHLSKHYECLAVGEAVALLKAKKLPRRSAIVTFDDGYRDNLLALPILKQYHVPATIYITTGAVNRQRTFWWDEHETILGALDRLELHVRGHAHRWDLGTSELKQHAFRQLNRLFKSLPPPEQEEQLEAMRAAARDAGVAGPYADPEAMLSWDEVAALDAEPLITIGAHTIDHYSMRQLSDAELDRQIAGSRDELERRLGHPVQHFAYPFGREEHADTREFVAVDRAGFLSAVTTRPAHWTADTRASLHSLPRMAVDYSDTMDAFRWKLSGFGAHLQRRANAIVAQRL
jgi:peptidoglycan/xylan/chitin deacetylase (PgdA/CDA1 family)